MSKYSQFVVSNKTKGRISEWVSSLFLRCKGYSILHKNWCTRYGEVDIIAKKSKVIVFVEVKYRKRLDGGYYLISFQQRKRINRVLMNFLQKEPQYKNYDVRCDAIILSWYKLPMHIINI